VDSELHRHKQISGILQQLKVLKPQKSFDIRLISEIISFNVIVGSFSIYMKAADTWFSIMISQVLLKQDFKRIVHLLNLWLRPLGLLESR
jgi:uncharacterized protein (UPF0303 family)